jgi:hypothetical protein
MHLMALGAWPRAKHIKKQIDVRQLKINNRANWTSAL